MAKEVTVFVIDLGPSMARVAPERNESDLDLGLHYFYDLAANKLLGNRKTDYLSLVTCHAPVTNNFSAEESPGSYKNIEVLMDQERPSLDALKQVKQSLVPNENPVSDDESDLLPALVVAMRMLEKTFKYSFIRNIVVITNGQSPLRSFSSSLCVGLAGKLNEHKVNLVISGIDLFTASPSQLSETQIQNASNWKDLAQNLDRGSILDATHAKDLISNAPPIKSVKPQRAKQLLLRFGANYNELAAHPHGDTLNQDDHGLSFDIVLYPMTKPESYPTSKQYVVNQGGEVPHKVERQTQNYILQNIEANKDHNEVNHEATANEIGSGVDDDENSTRVRREFINKAHAQSGFKYSNYDLIATSKDLLDSAQLKCMEAIDILGFLKFTDLPYAYFTDESHYVLPREASSPKNIMGLNSLSQALLELDSVAIVRYVNSTRTPKSENYNFQVAALLPMKVKLESDILHTFSLVRLPFKEDEKIGNFPRLTNSKSKEAVDSRRSQSNENSDNDDDHHDSDPNEDEAENNGEKSREDSDVESQDKLFNYPSENTNKLMEEFINAKTLDSETNDLFDPNTVDSYKATMKNSSSSQLILPSNKIPSNTVDAYLSASSPAINKLHAYIKNTIKKSLEVDDLDSYLMDPKFIEKVLVDKTDPSFNEKSNNLFTTSNILRGNTKVPKDWLTRHNAPAEKTTQTLIKRLGVRYLDKDKLNEKKKKRKLERQDDLQGARRSKGDYGAAENTYAPAPSFDFS